MPLKTLTEWMGLLSGPDRQFSGDGFSVRAYGDGDEAYFVLERILSLSPWQVDQYVFHPRSGANPLFQQIRFLSECDFDIEVVLDRLAPAPVVITPWREFTRFDSIEVTRLQFGEVVGPRKLCLSRPADDRPHVIIEGALDGKPIATMDLRVVSALQEQSLRDATATLRGGKPPLVPTDHEFEEWDFGEGG